MYLSLFGTDRGNQRGYFSDNNKKINELTEASNKLLTTTTELTDPTKLKQIQFTIDPNGEINNLTQKINTLRIESGEVISNIQDIGNIFIGTASEFSVQTVADTGGIANWAKDATALLYSPEATDSIVTGNSIVNKKLLVNGHEIIDFQNGSSDI